jgi:hypothetical protein
MQTRKLIGRVAVDSGQLLISDPCYIDSEWEKEDFLNVRRYKHTLSESQLTYPYDFENYQQVIEPYGKTMNQLLDTGEWVQMEREPAHNGFSYNACCVATLSKDGHSELKFKRGNTGVGLAFRTVYGDGYYSVYGVYNKNGLMTKVEIEL